MFEQLIPAFIMLFVVMDPFSSIGPFLALTKGFKDEQRVKSANEAAVVAALLMVPFIFFGMNVLSMLGISLASFKIGGGIVLALLGLQIVLGFSLSKDEKKPTGTAVAIIIATPMLTGPGVLVTVIFLKAQYGLPVAILASLISLSLSWLLIRNAHRIQQKVGSNVIEIFSKIMGLLLVALAIEFISSGIMIFAKGG
ncbi:MarC family integral membrane protein [Candidatus Norongarragalina meridionalis]|nr:MarC family integral membrane protein [Candidatus Norongarragalina meridionalis]